MDEIVSECGKGWIMYRGDCAEVMASFADRSVDHVITDPPYEEQAHTNLRRARKGGVHMLAPLDFAPIGSDERVAAGAAIARLAKRWSLVFCQVEAAMLWRDAIVAGGGANYRRTCIWVKPDGMPQLTGDRPGMGYESIVTCHAKGRSVWNGGGVRGVFTHNANVMREGHPTQKPIALMLELIDLFTDEGEVVLDPFAGSGTTGIAAIRKGRKFIGIERDETYFQLACDRLRAEEEQSTLSGLRSGQLPLLAGAK